MRRISWAASVAALAVLALTAFAGSAPARRLRVNDQNYEWIWEGAAGRLRMSTAGRTIACNITLKGQFEAASFEKVTTPALARITETVNPGAGECQSMMEERFVALASTPWEVRYESFTGTLPNISSIIVRVIRGGFRLTLGTEVCDYPFETNRYFRATIAVDGAGRLTSITPDVARRIPSTSAGLVCRLEEATFENAGVVLRRETMSRIALSLI